MEQNPYESPIGTEVEGLRPFRFRLWIPRWSGPVVFLIGLFSVGLLAVFKPELSNLSPVWTYPVYAMAFIAIIVGILLSLVQVAAELREMFS